MLATPIVLVVDPPPVISAHLSVPNALHVDPVGIDAGPCPPQSMSISPSLDEVTNPLPPSNKSPESSLVTVVVVVSVVVVSVVVEPCPSFCVSITIVSTMSITT